ncbi:DMT family transporter [Fluviispira vulneris]|uniref:DMT family transporter n=1 Tax=Fluviispira vulneris TaxID=2763012 RepID=UPI0016458780|nr:DMT family transporter [Fluviispira vulneris]
MTKSKDIFLALFGGVLLALMVTSNSLLAQNTNAVFASWFAHGIGASVILTILIFSYTMQIKSEKSQAITTKVQWWLYLGGVAGAFVVFLSSVVINKGLSLSAAISLILVGQILFGIFSDSIGLFGTIKRKIHIKDFIVILLVLTGSYLILFWK